MWFINKKKIIRVNSELKYKNGKFYIKKYKYTFPYLYYESFEKWVENLPKKSRYDIDKLFCHFLVMWELSNKWETLIIKEYFKAMESKRKSKRKIERLLTKKLKKMKNINLILKK